MSSGLSKSSLGDSFFKTIKQKKTQFQQKILKPDVWKCNCVFWCWLQVSSIKTLCSLAARKDNYGMVYVLSVPIYSATPYFCLMWPLHFCSGGDFSLWRIASASCTTSPTAWMPKFPTNTPSSTTWPGVFTWTKLSQAASTAGVAKWR